MRAARTTAIAALGACVLLVAIGAAHATSAPVSHLYDVHVTGTLDTKFLLPTKRLPLDFGFKEKTTWTETYREARLNVHPVAYPEGGFELKLESRGTITGTITYSTTGPGPKSCKSVTKRPEPALLTIEGTPYDGSVLSGETYRLYIATGRRRTGGRSVRPPRCGDDETPRWVRIARTSFVGVPGSVVSGLVDTRATSLTALYHTPEESQLHGFPLDALATGEGFTIELTGTSVQQSGRFISKGRARIVFTPHAS